jgi:hypothetical protein
MNLGNLINILIQRIFVRTQEKEIGKYLTMVLLLA